MGEDVPKLKMCVLKDEDGSLTEIPSKIPTISITATGFDELAKGFSKAAQSVNSFAHECKMIFKLRRVRSKQLAKIEKMYSKAFYSGRISCEQYCSTVLKISIREMLYK